MGLAVVLLAAALPVVRIGAVVMTIDPPFLACWSWALVCVWRGLGRAELSRNAWVAMLGLEDSTHPTRGAGSHGHWLAAAIFCAFGVLAKYTMVLLPAAVVGYCLFHRRQEFRRAGVLLLLGGTAAGWLPIIVWNANHDWVTFRHVFGQV